MLFFTSLNSGRIIKYIFGCLLIFEFSCKKNIAGQPSLGVNKPPSFIPSIELTFQGDSIHLTNNVEYSATYQSTNLYFYVLSADEATTGGHFKLEYYGGPPSISYTWYSVQSISLARADTTYFNYDSDGSVDIMSGSFESSISGAFGAGLYTDQTGPHYKVNGNFQFLKQHQ